MDNVTPIRQVSGPTASITPPKAPRRRRSPVKSFHMELAIDEQRTNLWRANAIIESVSLALTAHFGRDWPTDIPEFRMALGVAAHMINDVTGDLELALVEERAKQLAAEVSDGK